MTPYRTPQPPTPARPRPVAWLALLRDAGAVVLVGGVVAGYAWAYWHFLGFLGLRP